MLAVAQEKIYTMLAALINFPNADTLGAGARCVEALRARPEYPKEAADEVESFVKKGSEMSLDSLQGIYSYTFEISSGEYTLDMGYHLFDGFKRANALIALKETYKRMNFDYDAIAKGELPDHLPVMLKFLAFIDDEALASEMRQSFLIKSVESLNKNFEKKKDEIYAHVIRAIAMVVDVDVKLSGAEKKPAGKA